MGTHDYNRQQGNGQKPALAHEHPSITRQRPRRRRTLTLAQLLWLAVLLFASLLAWNTLEDIEQLQAPVTLIESGEEISVDPSVQRPFDLSVDQTEVASSPADLTCMRSDNTPDDAIIRCHLGKSVHQDISSSGQGVVPRAYRAHHDHLPRALIYPTDPIRESEQHWVVSWGSSESYLAAWEIVNNHIDATSVCGNYRKGSASYSECRKGAKEYFKQKCQDWRARYAKDKQSKSNWMEERYCSAQSKFNPVG
jgi:hypothetical protein